MGDHDATAPLESDAPAALEQGARVGSYEIVRALGRGSYGAVYEALRSPLGKRVALKVLHAEHAARRDLVTRFTREAELVAGLEHPHIVQVFDVGTHQGVPYFAMEYLDGETLGARLAREGRLHSSDAVDLLLGVLSAVAAAHARGVIHRDLKPDNVFLARMPVGPPLARLLDFGIAKVLEADVALTGTRAFLGTPLYMSPEQAAQSRDLTGATDQWSLAVILYECVTGARPFQAKTLLALLNAISDDAPMPAHERETTVPKGLSDVLARALAKRPEARFPSVNAFGAALLPFASPKARAYGADFFGVDLDDPSAEDSLRPTEPAQTRISGTPLPPGAPAAVPAAPVHDVEASAQAAHAATMRPAVLPPAATSATLDPAALAPRPGRAPRKTLVAVAALAALGVFTAWTLRTRTTPHATVTAAVVPAGHVDAPPRATQVEPPVTRVNLPAPRTPALVTADVPPVADAPTPEVARHGHGRTHGRHAPGAPGAPARTPTAAPGGSPRRSDPTDCPNGICSVD